MRTSSQLLFLCVSVGLVFALQGHPIADVRGAGLEGGSMERSQTIEGRPASSSEGRDRSFNPVRSRTVTAPFHGQGRPASSSEGRDRSFNPVHSRTVTFALTGAHQGTIGHSSYWPWK
uniref:Conotoxin superfamily H n=1 Tax=Conus magus TaxID=6492 RepID=A0A679PF98_CONMA|nr:TPA_inf: conotoxin superfamily H [Conus magus]